MEIFSFFFFLLFSAFGRLEEVQQKWQREYGEREEEMLQTHSKEMVRLKDTIISEYENERQRVERVEQEHRQEIAGM